MIAFFLSPIGRIVAIAAFVMMLVSGALYKVQLQGEQKAIIAIDRANQSARDAADKAERDVLACPPGRWNREAHTCGQ